MLILTWLLTIPLWAAAQDGGDPAAGYAEARAELETALVTRLEEFAEWCTKSKLYGERDRAWRLILEYDPNHAAAHKGLGHRKNKTGKWIEGNSRRPPKNRSDEHLAEVPKRWGEAVTPFRDGLLDLLDEHSEGLSPADRELVLNEILAIDPDDPRVRAIRGEVKLGDRWVMPETASGKKRRPAMKALVQAGREGAPRPERLTPSQELSVDWTSAWSTPLLRVYTTGEEREALDTANAVHAARELFNGALGVEAAYPKTFRIFLLADPAEKETLLLNHPDLTATDRAFLERVEGAGIPHTGDFCHWANNVEQRVDGIVRISLNWLLRDAFDLDTKQGWVHEGFGLYLARNVVGTRLNWFAQPSRYLPKKKDDEFRARLYDKATNWMNEAHLMFQRDERPSFRSFLNKNVNALTSEELLFSYVIAAYLLEGRPDETPELLRRIGERSAPQAQVIEEVLGMDVDAFDARVRGWLAERR